MAKITFVVSSILNGIQPSLLFGGKGQYVSGIGIDPEMPATDDASDTEPSGIARPVNYEKFSGENVDSAPIKIIKNPKDTFIYVVLANGKLIRYNSDLSGETTIGRVQESSMAVAARDAEYYNNYLYIFTPTDVSRYGPLDGSPSIDDEWWTGTLSNPALTDATFPETLFNVGYLNHKCLSHVDGALYFLDFKDGIGYVHMINTQAGSAQGSDDSGARPSAYAVLDLPPDYVPLTLESDGNNIVVSASFTTDSEIVQGAAALFWWNPADTEPSFFQRVPLLDTLCPVIKCNNGTIYGISGDIAGGYRLFQYVGGATVKTLEKVYDGVPPLQNAIEVAGDRIVWGANLTTPMICSGLYAYGSDDSLARGLHMIAVSGFT